VIRAGIELCPGKITYEKLPCSTISFIASAGILFACAVHSQVADGPTGNIAGIPVNYTEAKDTVMKSTLHLKTWVDVACTARIDSTAGSGALRRNGTASTPIPARWPSRRSLPHLTRANAPPPPPALRLRPCRATRFPFTNESLSKSQFQLPTLFITGDSTAARGQPVARGWGALPIDYFDTNKVNLSNPGCRRGALQHYSAESVGPGDGRGQAGRFCRDRIRPQQRDRCLESARKRRSRPGRGGPGRPASCIPTAGTCAKFIADVRAKGGIPIVSTITVRNKWANGKVERLKEQQPGQGAMSDWSRLSRHTGEGAACRSHQHHRRPLRPTRAGRGR